MFADSEYTIINKKESKPGNLMANITGQFEGRVFSNWSTLYHVYRFKTDKGRIISAIFQGSEMPLTDTDYTLQGSWRNSDVYGWQFYTSKLETTESFTERFRANIRDLQAVLSL